ncbi:hypothetical protein ACQQ2N_00950 [Dokdonella sp. MW10]|uniref:hypothetical protein n=1 Tax=Dokdonella sp. MW10 TaxID=2992926 RepID=UPI003F818D3E
MSHATSASAVLVFIVALVACGRETPGDVKPVAEATPSASHGDCLSRLPVGTLEAPLAALHARDFDAVPLDEAGQACVAAVFGDRTLGTPAEVDAGHAAVQAFHGEDADLRYATMPRRKVRLWQLGDDHVPRWWLLRIDTGLAMEGARYDVVLSTDAEGRLVDRMLVGADGVRYRRDADLRGARGLVVREDTGRESEQGPGYAAAFEVDADGRLRHVADADTSPLVAQLAEGADELDSASVVEVAGSFGEVAPLREMLFPADGPLEDAIEHRALGDGTPAVFALGQTDAVGGLVLHVLVPAGQGEAGVTTYVASSLAIDEATPPLNAEVIAREWHATPDGAAIRVRLRYDEEVPGGDPATGEPATTPREHVVAARYDAGSHALRIASR